MKECSFTEGGRLLTPLTDHQSHSMKRKRHGSHGGRNFGSDGNRVPHTDANAWDDEDFDVDSEDEGDEDSDTYLSWGIDRPTRDRDPRQRGPRPTTRFAKWDDNDDEDDVEDEDYGEEE